MKREVTAEDLTKDVLRDFKGHYVFSGSSHLLLNNLIFSDSDTFSNFVRKFSKNVALVELILKDVEFENVTLSVSRNLFIHDSTCRGVVKVRYPTIDTQISGSSFYSLSIGSGSESLYLSGTSVSNLRFEITEPDTSTRSELSMQELEVKGSHITNIFGLVHFLKDNISTVVVFHPDSSICNKSKSAYRLLKRISDRSNDVVQSHNLHNKILELETNSLDNDSKALLFFQWLTNNHGRSFLLPIVWIIIVNFSFLAAFYFLNDLNLPSLSQIISYILSLNPLNPWTFVDIQNSIIQNFDNFRRVIIAVLIYQTITAARRFSYNK